MAGTACVFLLVTKQAGRRDTQRLFIGEPEPAAPWPIAYSGASCPRSPLIAQLFHYSSWRGAAPRCTGWQR
jgi:hypothetical protein